MLQIWMIYLRRGYLIVNDEQTPLIYCNGITVPCFGWNPIWLNALSHIGHVSLFLEPTFAIHLWVIVSSSLESCPEFCQYRPLGIATPLILPTILADISWQLLLASAYVFKSLVKYSENRYYTTILLFVFITATTTWTVENRRHQTLYYVVADETDQSDDLKTPWQKLVRWGGIVHSPMLHNIHISSGLMGVKKYFTLLCFKSYYSSSSL